MSKDEVGYSTDDRKILIDWIGGKTTPQLECLEALICLELSERYLE